MKIVLANNGCLYVELRLISHNFSNSLRMNATLKTQLTVYAKLKLPHHVIYELQFDTDHSHIPFFYVLYCMCTVVT